MSSDSKPTQIDPAKCHRFKDMVDYSEGSVVSRIVLKNSAGNITLFSFDKGQSLSEHTTPFDALVQVIEGEVELVIGGNSITASEGETVLMPANVPHAVNAVKRFKMLLTMLKGN